MESGMHARLLHWQATARLAHGDDLPRLLHDWCRYLALEGAPACRMTLALNTLHPQIQALRYVWYDDLRDPGPFPSPALVQRRILSLDGCTVDEAFMSYGARDTEPLRRSPFWALMQGEVDCQDFPLAPGGGYPFPILDDLAAQGYTHYLAYSLPGLEAQVSLVSRQPGGFDALQREAVAASVPVLALLLEGPLKELILKTVLECYVGYSPAKEIRHGRIRPGAMLDLAGAIWFSDIRNYSMQSQAQPSDAFVENLNAYYECVVKAIHAQGGEVLKFIGDAILAIFPQRDDGVPADGTADACVRALAAAEAATRDLAAHGVSFTHGVGLHVGRFQFGNIGSLQRMDFTAIGNEVNVASRIEAQCKLQGERLLMSAEFARRCGAATREVARVALRGIAGEYVLHAPLVAE
jgi:adenylate cyclase